MHFRFHSNYLLSWKILEEISRRPILFHIKLKAVYLPYQTYVHTSFFHSSELTEIWCLMEVSTIDVYYCVLYLQIQRFYLHGTVLSHTAIDHESNIDEVHVIPWCQTIIMFAHLCTKKKNLTPRARLIEQDWIAQNWTLWP